MSDEPDFDISALLNGGTNNNIEPNADFRTLAVALRQFYVALVNEGFTESQALTAAVLMFTGA